MEVRDFFNLYWGEKQIRWFDRYYDFLKIINEDVFSKLSSFGKKKILVVGLGDTKDKCYFNRIGGEVTSIDISLKGLKKLKEFQKIQMDANEMGFKKDSFDVVFLRTVMLHLDHKKVLVEIKRVLRKGGKFFWVEPMQDNIFLWIYRFIVSPGKLTTVDYLTYKEIQSYRFFFRHLWHREYYLFTVLLIPPYVLFPQIRRLVQFLIKLEMRVIDRIKWTRRLCWISYGYGEV